MPAGLGKTIKVAVFASDSYVEKLKEVGTDIFGNDKLLADIKNGKIEFEKLFATPDQMPLLKPLAKILGPKGLMPN